MRILSSFVARDGSGQSFVARDGSGQSFVARDGSWLVCLYSVKERSVSYFKMF